MIMKVKVAQLCPTLCNPLDYRLWNSPGQNTGVSSLSFLHGIFPTQGLNPGLLHCRWILYQLSQAWHAIIHRVTQSQAQLKQLRTAHVSPSSSLSILRAKIHLFLFFAYLLEVMYFKWVSLVAQLVKNPPAMWETWVRSLSWEDPMEKGKATHSSILVWRISCTV